MSPNAAFIQDGNEKRKKKRKMRIQRQMIKDFGSVQRQWKNLFLTTFYYNKYIFVSSHPCLHLQDVLMWRFDQW